MDIFLRFNDLIRFKILDFPQEIEPSREKIVPTHNLLTVKLRSSPYLHAEDYARSNQNLRRRRRPCRRFVKSGAQLFS